MVRGWAFGAALLVSLPAAVAAADWRPPVTRATVEQQFTLYQPDYRRLKEARLAKQGDRMNGL